MNEMGIAFELLGVGMVTVFTILALVVILGNLIIRFVNHFIPELQKVSVKPTEVLTRDNSSRKMAAIISAVNTITNGTGRVTKIEKM